MAKIVLSAKAKKAIADSTGLVYLAADIEQMDVSEGQKVANLLEYYCNDATDVPAMQAVLEDTKTNNEGFDYVWPDEDTKPEPEETVSTYKFVVGGPATAVEGSEIVMPITLQTDVLGDKGIDAILAKSVIVSAPEDGHCTMKATDSASTEHTFTDEAEWGPVEGFNLPAQYEATTDWHVTYSKPGTYVTKMSLVYAATKEEIMSIQHTVEVTAAEPVKPDVSTYTIETVVPESIVAGTAVTVNSTLKTLVEGNAGVDGVQIKYAVTSAPEDGHVTFKATDSQGQPWEFTDEGVWGPAEGFNLPAQYEVTTPFKLPFSAAGDYTVDISVVKVADSSVVVTASSSATVTAAAAKKTTRKAAAK